eukprot:COSAG02_NODE_1115_length_14499_cov_46.098958_11_plen_109_part_00
MHAMSVLTALLEMMREEQMERQDDGDSTPEILQKLAGKGGEFAEALKKAPTAGACVLTFGEVRETLGSARLGLIHFLVAMLRSGCVCLQRRALVIPSIRVTAGVCGCL